MPNDMWSLSDFRYDQSIESDEIALFADDRGGAPMSRAEGIRYAHDRGGNLVPQWPTAAGDVPACVVAKVAEPLRWESAPADSHQVDESLWFEASCGGRDFLVGNGHTFTGRMAAWCPHTEVGYNVSLAEMGEMSTETRYYVAGFLAGSEPGCPVHPDDVDPRLEEADLAAWEAALSRFRRTGHWHGRWGTCRACGCVLLPDTDATYCHEHAIGTGPDQR